jgi:hypothetical protein
MRCELRDFDASSEIDIYVFSQRQAEYLRSRLGGTLHHHSGVVDDRPRSLHSEGPMSSAEKMKVMRLRLKMQAAGVTDARRLPEAAHLPDRIVVLANATFTRKGTA